MGSTEISLNHSDDSSEGSWGTGKTTPSLAMFYSAGSSKVRVGPTGSPMGRRLSRAGTEFSSPSRTRLPRFCLPVRPALGLRLLSRTR